MSDVDNNIVDVLNHYVSISINIAYAEYDIDKPFIEQVEDNIKELDKFYTGLKELFDNISKGFKERTGETLDEIIEKLDEKGEDTNDSN